MGRRRRDYLDRVNGMLVSWAEFCLRLQDSGYPHCSVEYRLMRGETGGRPAPGSRIPYGAFMAEHVARVDRAIRQEMPTDLVEVVHRHWLRGEKMPRHRVTEVLLWLAGHMK